DHPQPPRRDHRTAARGRNGRRAGCRAPRDPRRHCQRHPLGGGRRAETASPVVTGPDARVRDLVAGGRITVEEGERLRLALRGTGGVPRIVRNPAEYLRPLHATLLAVAVVVASLAVSQLGVRFDGALDMHRVAGVPSWRTALLDQ